MRLICNWAFVVLLLHFVSAEEEAFWTWGEDGENVKPLENSSEKPFDLEPSASAITEQRLENDTIIEEVITNILASSRQGRNLDGYDEVYSDPNLQEALQKGDDSEARNVIKDRLCHLGLMQCEGETILEKRPYHIAPEDLVYAQPVAINPVGRPIPTIPLKGNRGHYGPPKPMPFPPGPPGNFRPPHGPAHFGGPPPHLNGPPRRGYGPPKPFYGDRPFLSGPPTEFLSKPPSYEIPIEPDDSPYAFEHGSSGFQQQSFQHKDKKVEVVVNAQGGKVDAGVQQHVHHHFHHDNGQNVKVPVPVIVNNPQLSGGYGGSFKPSVSIGGTTLGASYGGQSTSFSGLGAFATKPIYEDHGPQSFIPTTPPINAGGSFGSSSLYGGNNFGSSSLYSGSSSSSLYGGSGFGNSLGASVGSYGSSALYKKELNLNANGVQSNHLQSNFGEKYQGVESARSENYDCICVPYDQCPSHEVIGRKDDLYLALDPRNLKSDIEAIAEEERVITDGNGTMTLVRVVKAAPANASIENEEVKKVSKREATPLKDEKKVEARTFGQSNKNIKPTFGVSFGLPHQGGYPVGPNHAINPNGGGINLGLVSVSPHISVQVTKDDFGEKVVKPFVNLHVTPNDFLIHKANSLFAYKKHLIHNQHYHHHEHKPHFAHGSNYGHYGPVYTDHSPFPGHHHPEPYFEQQPHYEEYPNFNEHYDEPHYGSGGFGDAFYGRNLNESNNNLFNQFQQQYNNQNAYGDNPEYNYDHSELNSNQNYFHNNERLGKSLHKSNPLKFPTTRRRRDATSPNERSKTINAEKRQAYYPQIGRPKPCGPRHVCCRKPLAPNVPPTGHRNQCGTRHSQGINGRIKNPVYVDGDSEFGEYPWQVAILKKDPKESVYVCGGTLIDPLHIITAAHCVKTYTGFDLRVRLGEWDVNHDVEFFPYIERDIHSVTVHPEFYAGTLYNDIAILRMDKPVDFSRHPHISPACLPSPHDDYTGTRCWTTGWGKDAFGDFGKYQNILKEVDVPIVNNQQCQQQLRQTRLGYDFQLHPGFVCAGGEEGKDACKGDGGGPMVCERGGTFKVVGVVSWGIGCGQHGVPGVYVKVAHYLDWIRQVTQRY